MAKKKTSQKPVVPEPSPSIWMYLMATLQVAGEWLKHNKLKLAAGIMAVAVLTGLIVIIQLRPAELTNDQIVVQISRELSINGDGNPAILSVVDDNKTTQPFLEQAQNGDKVVLYYKAKKAVLFRPSEQRIVHEGAYVPPDAKIFVRKGTSDNGRVTALKEQLKGMQDVELTSEDVSPRQDYQGLTLVHVTDRYDDKIMELEKLLNTKVVRMPAGESFPDADILIIVGS